MAQIASKGGRHTDDGRLRKGLGQALTEGLHVPWRAAHAVKKQKKLLRRTSGPLNKKGIAHKKSFRHSKTHIQPRPPLLLGLAGCP